MLELCKSCLQMLISFGDLLGLTFKEIIPPLCKEVMCLTEYVGDL